MTYDAKYNAKHRDDEETKKSFKFAEENWKPLYLIKMYDDDPALIEMSFDLTNYQPQFSGSGPTGPRDRGARSPDSAPPRERQGPHGRQGDSQEKELSQLPSTNPDDLKDPPRARPRIPDHLFEQGSRGQVDAQRDWQGQGHPGKVVEAAIASLDPLCLRRPWLWLINGANHTNYCGGWTLVNMQEVAIVSGYAAAVAIGAKYPFEQDKDCARLFNLYNALAHLSFKNAKKALKGVNMLLPAIDCS